MAQRGRISSGLVYGQRGFTKTTIVQNGLVLSLDAGNPASYSGTGTVWYDLSPSGNNFNIVSGAWSNSSGGVMNFQGSYGCAKNSSNMGFSTSSGVTYHVVTRNILSSGNWRTLTRGYGAQHQVIIYSGGYNIGMYDNANSSSFNDSGYSQTSLPNYGTSNWISLYFTFPTSSPYWNMSYNDTPGTIRGSITSSNALYTTTFGALGAYHNETTDPSNASQFWGDIAIFNVYNRVLTSAELLQNFNAIRSRYGL